MYGSVDGEPAALQYCCVAGFIACRILGVHETSAFCLSEKGNGVHCLHELARCHVHELFYDNSTMEHID